MVPLAVLILWCHSWITIFAHVVLLWSCTLAKKSLIFSRPIVSIARVNLSASIISLRFLDAPAFTAVRFGGSIRKNVSIASS